MYNKILLKKNLTEAYSPHLNASIGTFCAQIGQLFESQWVFEVCMIEKRQIALIEGKCRRYQNSSDY